MFVRLWVAWMVFVWSNCHVFVMINGLDDSLSMMGVKRGDEDVRTKVVGGPSSVDVESEAIVDAGRHAVMMMNARSNNLYATVLVRVLSGTKQVVAGMKYHLRVEVGDSVCRNVRGKIRTIEECPLLRTSNTQVYSMDLLWRSWMTPPYEFLEEPVLISSRWVD